VILEAEGARQSAILRAEGQALALDRVFQVAHGVDSKTLSLQYLDALRTMANAPATKFVLPMEFTNLVRPFVENTSGSSRARSTRDESIDQSGPQRTPRATER
jgi:regulator of protease activity HflC (stomatin/prohibitin superfamily)